MGEAEPILMQKEGPGVWREEGDPRGRMGWEGLSQRGEGPEEGSQGRSGKARSGGEQLTCGGTPVDERTRAEDV